MIFDENNKPISSDHMAIALQHFAPQIEKLMARDKVSADAIQGSRLYDQYGQRFPGKAQVVSSSRFRIPLTVKP